MNSSLTLNELLNESFAVSRTCHKVRGCSRSISSQFLQRRKKKTNKQTNEAARPEESGYDIENQSAHTHLVSALLQAQSIRGDKVQVTYIDRLNSASKILQC